jgi:hypothetical protein
VRNSASGKRAIHLSLRNDVLKAAKHRRKAALCDIGWGVFALLLRVASCRLQRTRRQYVHRCTSPTRALTGMR